MARKTFISYKFSEAGGIRDKILKAMGDDATYYQGETSDSPDLTDTTTENIKRNLKDMIHGTSVTIVVVSPCLIESSWIDWEIEYSLKEITRVDTTSRTNGVVGLIMKVNGGYEWLKTSRKNDDGCTVSSYETSKLYPIINQNRFNLKSDDRYSCPRCKCFDMLKGSYISLIEEDAFLGDPQKYIENAYEKGMNVDNFELTKQK